MSPDAAKILAMPEARHPWLAPFCRALASHSRCTLVDAKELVASAMVDCKLTSLDIEFVDERAVPFAVTTPADGRSDFQEGVAQHVRNLLKGEAR